MSSVQTNTIKMAKKNKKQNSLSMVMMRLIRDKSTLVGLIIIGILVLMALLAPWLTPYDYSEMDLLNTFAKPSFQHPCGTDELGRDILTRLMYGGRYSLAIGLFGVIIAAGFGVIFGAIAGYFGGQVDNVIMRVMDILQSFPQLLLAIVISAVLGAGFDKCIIALGVAGIPTFSRQMRGSILSVRSMEYIEAANSINCSPLRIIMRHVVPNSLSPVIVHGSLSMAVGILAAASLSFIGLGVQPPTPEWGAMLSGSRAYIRDFPHMVLFPGIFIMISVLSLNLVGDALRDALDPKLKK